MDFNQFDNFIFDYGGVIIDVDYSATISAFESLGINHFDKLFSQASQSGLFDAIEKGEISSQLFINRLLDLLPKGTSPNQVAQAWNAIIKDIKPDAVETLKTLKKRGKRLFLLSNTNALHISIADRKWKEQVDVPMSALFEKVYYSHLIGMRKPNTEIFDFVCSENNLKKEETVFIDDSIQHIEGAKAFGLITHHLRKEEKIYQLFS